MIQSPQVTEVGEALTQIAIANLLHELERPKRLSFTVNLSADEEFDQFQIRGRVAPDAPEITFASDAGGLSTPVHPLLRGSALVTQAANTSGVVLMDVEGLAEVSLYAATAAAVAATGVLTAGANPTGGVKATGTLTLTDVPAGAVPATGVLTGTTIAAGDTVTIDGLVYTFVAALTRPHGIRDVLVGATDSDSLDNLIAAINAGPGSSYVYSEFITAAHPTVSAAAGAGDTMDVTARARGTGGNSIATTDTLTAGGFGAATLENGVAGDTVTIGAVVYTFDDDTVGLEDLPNHVEIGADADGTLDNLEAAITGGAGEGTVYGTGTVAHPLVTAANQGDDTIDVTTLLQTGASIATTETSGVASWGAATLQGGVAPDTLELGDITYTFDAAGALIDEPNHVLVGVAATNTLDNLIAAVNNAAGEGTTYGTGTAENSLVNAAAGAGDTIDLTAATAGKAGNSIPQDASGSSALTFSTPMAGGTAPTTVTVEVGKAA